ncbi:hypothetical protein D7Y61_02205 [Stenotrophomonas maltophilia]|nr:hypothetical protein [Stenotrophomonas maltophilia]
MGFDEASHHYAAMVASKIPTVSVLHQFYMEELDAASQGNALARSFVEESRVSEADYKGALNRSNPAVDGPDGPQQLLLKICMQLFDNEDLMVRFRLQIVTNLIEQMEVTTPSLSAPIESPEDFERLAGKIGKTQATLEMRNQALNGNAFCQETMSQVTSMLIDDGNASEQLLEEQYTFTKLSAESDNPQAQYNLGLIYMRRINTDAEQWSRQDVANMKAALMWHERALKNGVGQADAAIAMLKSLLEE